jgi:transcriptional regulator with XRE-family HTH domain
MFSIYGNKEALAQLGQRLRAQRLHRNWTQAQVARMAGISLPPYARLEKGDGAMSFGTVARILGIFGLAEALGDLVPEVEIKTLAEILKPARQRAKRRSGTHKITHAKRPA